MRAVYESETETGRLAVELRRAGFEPAEFAAGANPYGTEAVAFSGNVEIVPSLGDCCFEVGRVMGGHDEYFAHGRFYSLSSVVLPALLLYCPGFSARCLARQ